jgi:glycosyltransferase involved in cell wall biosynthesis
MPEPRLSVLIVARNEEDNLLACLASVRFADERVVIVDAASCDATFQIARDNADHVILREFDNFAQQRNAALDIASSEWVLSIDADERVTTDLAAEIRAILSDLSDLHVGYRVPIRSEILGRPFKFSGTQQDLPLRLFRREFGRWTGLVHETVEIDGPIGQLSHVLEHRTLADIRVFLTKIDHYTTLEARDQFQAGKRYRLIDLALRPVWTFLKLYLYKQGWRDGVEGFVFCLLSGLSVLVRTWKLRELERCEQAAGQTRRVRYADQSSSREHSSGPHSGLYKPSKTSHSGPYEPSSGPRSGPYEPSGPSHGGVDEKAARPSAWAVAARRWAS